MICVLCRKKKPLEDFFVDHKGNVSKACKQCAFEGQKSDRGSGGSIVSSAERKRRLTDNNELFCNVCHQWRDTSLFYKNANTAQGYNYTCKGCSRKIFKNCREKNKEKNELRRKVEGKTTSNIPVESVKGTTANIRDQLLGKLKKRSGDS